MNSLASGKSDGCFFSDRRKKVQDVGWHNVDAPSGVVFLVDRQFKLYNLYNQTMESIHHPFLDLYFLLKKVNMSIVFFCEFIGGFPGFSLRFCRKKALNIPSREFEVNEEHLKEIFGNYGKVRCGIDRVVWLCHFCVGAKWVRKALDFKLSVFIGNLRGPPNATPPKKNKALLRDY